MLILLCFCGVILVLMLWFVGCCRVWFVAYLLCFGFDWFVFDYFVYWCCSAILGFYVCFRLIDGYDCLLVFRLHCFWVLEAVFCFVVVRGFLLF